MNDVEKLVGERVVKIDFKQRGLLKRVPRYKGIYAYPGEVGFYIRPVVSRQQITYKLHATTLTAADRERGRLISDLAKFHAGLGPNPFAPAGLTVAGLCDFYLERDCPRKNTARRREGKQLVEEKFRAGMLKKWPGSKLAAREMTPEKWRAYRDWRKRNLVRAGKGGERAIDIERVTLSNAFRCALRHSSETGLTTNPMAESIERFRDPGQVTHCRDHMPRSGDEVHALATYFFQASETEVLGWFVLLQAIIGARASEMIKLRMDGSSKEHPGYLAGRKLYLPRSTTHKGTAAHVDLTAEELRAMQAHRAWHAARHAGNPWMFPSPRKAGQPIEAVWPTRRMVEVAPLLEQGKRTSHGLRAFRVNVLRGRGLSDAEIALRIGHKSGGKLIVEVYGEGLDYVLSWMPASGVPAWRALGPVEQYEQLELNLANLAAPVLTSLHTNSCVDGCDPLRPLLTQPRAQTAEWRAFP